MNPIPTQEELRKLDAFLAEHMFGARITAKGWFETTLETGANGIHEFTPTTDRADAMAVLEKCLEQGEVELWRNQHGHHAMDLLLNQGDGETLTLAICRFAEKMVKEWDTK